MTTGQEELFSLKSRVRHRDVGGDGVIVQLDSSRVLVVNDVGLYIVQSLREPITRGALLAKIVNEFDVSAEQAKIDLQHYLAELKKEKVLEVSEPQN